MTNKIRGLRIEVSMMPYSTMGQTMVNTQYGCNISESDALRIALAKNARELVATLKSVINAPDAATEAK